MAALTPSRTSSRRSSARETPSLRAAVQISKWANLANANLVGAELRGARFHQTNLTRANLEGNLRRDVFYSWLTLMMPT